MYVTRLLPLAMNVTIDILDQCYTTSSQVRVVHLSTTATLFDDARDGVQVRC